MRGTSGGGVRSGRRRTERDPERRERPWPAAGAALPFGAAFLALAALLLAPAGAVGQEDGGSSSAPVAVPPAEADARAAEARATDDLPPRFSVALRGGFSSPKGDLADLGDDGLLLAMALGYRLSPRVTLLVEGSLENLERGGGGQVLGAPLGPDIELWRVMALASVELTDPGASRWEVAVQAGAGPTVMAAGAFVASEALTTVEPTLMAGVLAGYDLGRRVTVFVRGGGSIWFDLPDDTYFGKEVTMTHTLGLRIRL